ncbi:hypothetical protein NP511_03230 [Natrinema thermotolerans]|uniref:Uncharacterized protein n=1 Tax=Natrinema thermotolerans TaxID=121872 RepID=A0AAF0T3L4_9EURY|nr:hypothetical protein [Natrinema thermotolerans]QCC57575.1 hypothetical protein DVR14_02525 [Natrinema thermotolerans]WMT10158.1 hypothetical protein NP511_03230 [Natrinema thermotolerans]
MDTQQLYVVGLVLGLIGSLVTVVSLVLAGFVTTAVIGIGATFAFAVSLENIFSRTDFDREHSLSYRIVNWGGAVIVVALGLLMLTVGLVSFRTFV